MRREATHLYHQINQMVPERTTLSLVGVRHTTIFQDVCLLSRNQLEHGPARVLPEREVSIITCRNHVSQQPQADFNHHLLHLEGNELCLVRDCNNRKTVEVHALPTEHVFQRSIAS